MTGDLITIVSREDPVKGQPTLSVDITVRQLVGLVQPSDVALLMVAMHRLSSAMTAPLDPPSPEHTDIRDAAEHESTLAFHVHVRAL